MENILSYGQKYEYKKSIEILIKISYNEYNKKDIEIYLFPKCQSQRYLRLINVWLKKC